MKKPIKPRLPNKPTKPQQLLSKYKKLGRTYSWKKKISLADIVEKVKLKVSEKTGQNVENISLDEIFLDELVFRYHIIDGKINPKFSEQLKKYEEKVLPNYKTKLALHKKKLKQYEINMKIWKAWQLKQREDAVLNEMSKIQKQLDDIKSAKEHLVQSSGNVDETTKKTN